jgi:hypothetical protein
MKKNFPPTFRPDGTGLVKRSDWEDLQLKLKIGLRRMLFDK